MPPTASPAPAQASSRPLKLVNISGGISSRTRRFILLPLALIFGFATLVYSIVWMYHVRINPFMEFGISTFGSGQKIARVAHGSSAEQAGLRAGDCILAINGVEFDSPEVFTVPAKPAETVSFRVQRPGMAAPIIITGTFGTSGQPRSLAVQAAEQIISFYPIFFLAVGLAVLFTRLEDQNAWLLALLFAAFIAASDLPPSYHTLQGGLRWFVLGYRASLDGLITPLFYFFFAVFPVCSPVNRRVPWLKWVLLALGASFAISGFHRGIPQPWPVMQAVLGEKLSQWVHLGIMYGAIVPALASLASNVMAAPSCEAKRKLRIVLWGAALGVTPIAVVRAISDLREVPPPFWLTFFCVVLLWLFPISFAYAVVKHRVLEIPVLLKRSARYLLVRRGLVVFVVLLAASLVVLFSVAVSVLFPIGPKSAMAVGVVFGIALASASMPGLRQVTQRIDRAFFRGAYDARLILQDLAQKIPRFNTRRELALELQQRVNEALHPTWLAMYVESGPDYLETHSEQVPAGASRIARNSALVQYLARSGEPWDAYASPGSVPSLAEIFPAPQPDCIVTLPARSGEMLGLLVLGSRRSEEPYSGEDKLLLRSVAGQAGTALENLRMAEEIAERLEAERNAAREMEIARQVQSKLFPQTVPQLKTLELAGTCTQTLAVGGDYYDFVELGPGHLGLVVADVAGKGISAALLMANLQANLRSQYALALENLPLLLQRVNRLFYENTEPSHYTTMFFGAYDDASKRLTYANCGHCPPLLVRKDGSVQQLSSTATVLGLVPGMGMPDRGSPA